MGIDLGLPSTALRTTMIGMYHSPRRVDAAAATRAAILDAARAMFLDRGYIDVTVGDIAGAAQVAVPTVYASTGGKAAILSALLQPIVEDPSVEATLAAVATVADAARVIDVTAAGIRLTCERHWDTIHGLLLNAPAEPAADPVERAAGRPGDADRVEDRGEDQRQARDQRVVVADLEQVVEDHVDDPERADHAGDGGTSE